MRSASEVNVLWMLPACAQSLHSSVQRKVKKLSDLSSHLIYFVSICVTTKNATKKTGIFLAVKAFCRKHTVKTGKWLEISSKIAYFKTGL